MLCNEIQEFAKVLIEQVRDSAVRSCDDQMLPNMNTPIAKRWRAMLNNGDIEGLQKMMISDCVDETLFYLLQALDQGVFNISFNASNGKRIDLSEEGLGELSGWYMGSGGWRSQYSQVRFTDDFSDLT
ncbi:hypothetical protein ACH5Y9_25515 (plasmid) [Methylomonas sp. BW4-1]|uniref:hypothetical protein n=1 Tax=Methylomonas sp. BW4-1 TaxID=3376685 RepID=UPI0040410F99